MKTTLSLYNLFLATAVAIPSPPLAGRQSGASGTGPFPAKYTTDPGLPNHTIFVPQNIAAVNGTLPVVVWGNGACSANGLSSSNYLTEIASWGFIVIASGAPNGGGSTTAAVMKASIDFASTSTSGVFAKVNKNAIAAAGFSCGGIEAYEQAQDARVKALGIVSSGQMSEEGTKKVVPAIRKPVFFFLGGSSDIAYANGMRDYKALTAGVPSWNGNIPVGHGGTLGDQNGGKFGAASQRFFRWVLKGDTSVASYFTGNGAQQDGWTVERKDLDKIQS